MINYEELKTNLLLLALYADAEEAAEGPFVVARVGEMRRFGICRGEQRRRMEDAQAEECRQCEASAIAEKRQWQADDRNESDGHAEVDADVDGEHDEHGDASQTGWFIACPPRPMEADGKQY